MKEYNGEYQFTGRIPEETMKVLSKAFRLDRIVFNKLVIEALEHLAYCPDQSPRGTLEQLVSNQNELRERVLKLELRRLKE